MSTAHRRMLSAGLLLAALVPVVSATASGEASSSVRARALAYEPGELIVRYRDDTSKREEAQVRKEEHAKLIDDLPLVEGLELVRIKSGESVGGEASDFEDHAEVEYAEPNFKISASAVTPNDPLYASHL